MLLYSVRRPLIVKDHTVRPHHLRWFGFEANAPFRHTFFFFCYWRSYNDGRRSVSLFLYILWNLSIAMYVYFFKASHCIAAIAVQNVYSIFIVLHLEIVVYCLRKRKQCVTLCGIIATLKCNGIVIFIYLYFFFLDKNCLFRIFSVFFRFFRFWLHFNADGDCVGYYYSLVRQHFNWYLWWQFNATIMNRIKLVNRMGAMVAVVNGFWMRILSLIFFFLYFVFSGKMLSLLYWECQQKFMSAQWICAALHFMVRLLL